MTIKSYVQKEKNYLIELRRYFHAHPEVSLKEYETANKIEAELDKLAIPHQRIGDTGVYAWIDGDREGSVIALRADIDALNMQDLKDVEYRSQNDGVCHACGHDAHAATLLTAAKILASKKSEFHGRVKLCFQQAEEIGQGGRLFVQAGVLKDCERVFGAHVSSRINAGNVSITAGPNNASCDYFKIEITGKGAHVSRPDLGVDALYIASQVVTSLQSIVARTQNPLDPVVVGVGKLYAGTQYNIIAEHAVLEGTTRTFTNETRTKVNGFVEKIANEIAGIYGAEVKVTFEKFAAPLINDAQACEEVKSIAETILDKECIITNLEKAMGADDFADFLQEVKGMYAFIGTNNKVNENTAQAHHHGLFDIDEESLLISCNLYVDYALKILK